MILSRAESSMARAADVDLVALEDRVDVRAFDRFERGAEVAEPRCRLWRSGRR